MKKCFSKLAIIFKGISYDICSESNVSYFITLAHDFTQRYWWNRCTLRNSETVTHKTLVSYRRQLRNCLPECRLTWKPVGITGVNLLNFIRKILHRHLLQIYSVKTLDIKKAMLFVMCVTIGDNDIWNPLQFRGIRHPSFKKYLSSSIKSSNDYFQEESFLVKSSFCLDL